MSRLTADLVFDGAIALADDAGFEAITIRRLAATLEVKPMTIYHHVPNKEAIIDGMVDRVMGEIELPSPELGWREAATRRAHSAREVLSRHPWATPLIDSRTNSGEATLRHHEAVTACFRIAGFSIPLTGHAVAIIDAFVYGFALQEAALPETSGPEIAELAESALGQIDPTEFPYLVEFASEHVMQGDYSFGDEFTYGLELILDALAERAASEART